MRTKTTISISEARKKIFDIAEKVQKPDNYYTFTENGRPKAVLMSAEKFDSWRETIEVMNDSWRETIEVMNDFPNLKKDIDEARKDYKKGNYITLDELLAKQGYVLADKAKTKYGVQNRNSKKSPKRSKRN